MRVKRKLATPWRLWEIAKVMRPTWPLSAAVVRRAGDELFAASWERMVLLAAIDAHRSAFRTEILDDAYYQVLMRETADD